jgi:hypothetical protein
MTPRQALNNLDQAAANVQGNRQQHFILQTSITVLDGIVRKVEAEAAPLAKAAEETAQNVEQQVKQAVNETVEGDQKDAPAEATEHSAAPNVADRPVTPPAA